MEEKKKTRKKKYLYLRLQGLNNALAKYPLISLSASILIVNGHHKTRWPIIFAKPVLSIYRCGSS